MGDTAIPVTERDQCPVCEAYCHPYLSACPFCGTRRMPLFDDAMAVWQTLHSEAVLTDDQLAEFHAQKARLRGWEPDKDDPIWMGLLEDQRRPMGRGIWLQMVQKGARGLDRTTDSVAGAAIASLTLSYLGGLPAIPFPTDVDVRVEGACLLMETARAGAVLIRIPLLNVLAVQAFEANTLLLRSWVGLRFGDVISFPQPTFPGGSLVIVHAQEGVIHQWGVGNRSGLFTRKADFVGFKMMRGSLAFGCSHYARQALQGIEPGLHTRELGLQ
jgi:hypothetical protein